MFSRGKVVHDVVDGMLDVIVPGHVHVDEPEEGGTLDPEPLGPLAAGVETSGEHVEAEAVQVAGELVADASVATRDLLWQKRIKSIPM